MKKSIFTIAILLVFKCSFAQDVLTTTLTPPPSKEEMEMMKAYESYATPGNEHSMLAKDDGMWTEEITMWMTPGAPPMKTKSTATNSMILGGRYQQSVHKGTFDGNPFEGISTVAFDNARKVYISTWIDNMGTGIMIMEGNYNPKTKIISMSGKQVDPVTGKNMDVREEITIIDDNTQNMKMFITPIGGKEFQNMEIVMTRMKK